MNAVCRPSADLDLIHLFPKKSSPCVRTVVDAGERRWRNAIYQRSRRLREKELSMDFDGRIVEAGYPRGFTLDREAFYLAFCGFWGLRS